jgi:NitT/TauT family transport system ATP-binding protein
MSLVHLTQISKTFENGTKALDGFDVSVGAGEIVTLIGPSGCGKSTALRLIASLDEPSSGRVAWPEGRPEIGYVFQEPTLMPWASAYDNVWLPLRLRGTSRTEADDRIRAAIELVGLSEFTGAKPNELSGGMKMRVSIARALVTQPTLILMDEPFAALDEITRFRLNDELLALKERLGLTIVFVTHSIFEAVYLSSRVLVMTPRPGRIAEEFAIDEPLPRDESFRTSVRYAEHARAISAGLRAASAESRLDNGASGVHS